MADLLTRLVGALTRVDDDGNDVFGSDEVRHALPYLVFTLQLPLDELSEGMQGLVVETLAIAGAEREQEPLRALEKLRSYYASHPVAPGILDAVRAVFEGEGIDLPSRAADTVLGQTRASGVLGGGERPAGTVSGALARLSAFKRDDDDDDE